MDSVFKVIVILDEKGNKTEIKVYKNGTQIKPDTKIHYNDELLKQILAHANLKEKDVIILEPAEKKEPLVPTKPVNTSNSPVVKKGKYKLVATFGCIGFALFGVSTIVALIAFANSLLGLSKVSSAGASPTPTPIESPANSPDATATPSSSTEANALDIAQRAIEVKELQDIIDGYRAQGTYTGLTDAEAVYSMAEEWHGILKDSEVMYISKFIVKENINGKIDSDLDEIGSLVEAQIYGPFNCTEDLYNKNVVNKQIPEIKMVPVADCIVDPTNKAFFNEFNKNSVDMLTAAISGDQTTVDRCIKTGCIMGYNGLCRIGDEGFINVTWPDGKKTKISTKSIAPSVYRLSTQAFLAGDRIRNAKYDEYVVTADDISKFTGEASEAAGSTTYRADAIAQAAETACNISTSEYVEYNGKAPKSKNEKDPESRNC